MSYKFGQPGVDQNCDIKTSEQPSNLVLCAASNTITTTTTTSSSYQVLKSDDVALGKGQEKFRSKALLLPLPPTFSQSQVWRALYLCGLGSSSIANDEFKFHLSVKICQKSILDN